jgi:1-acyl-sn-glycerol-3-phosphate acyltransferase
LFFAGPIVRDAGTIFIDRSNRRDIPRAGEEILERLDGGEGVVVFPKERAPPAKRSCRSIRRSLSLRHRRTCRCRMPRLAIRRQKANRGERSRLLG